MTILLIWLICSKVLTFKLGQSNLRFHCPLKSTHLRYFWGHQWCSTTCQFSSVWHVVGLRAFLSEMWTWASLRAGECEWQKHLPFPCRSLQKPGCNLPLPLPQWPGMAVSRGGLWLLGRAPTDLKWTQSPEKNLTIGVLSHRDIWGGLFLAQPGSNTNSSNFGWKRGK